MALLRGEVVFTCSRRGEPQTYVMCLRMAELASIGEALGGEGGADPALILNKLQQGNVLENLTKFLQVALKRNHPSEANSSAEVMEIISDVGLYPLMQHVDTALEWAMPPAPPPPDGTPTCPHCRKALVPVVVGSGHAPNVDAPIAGTTSGS